MGNRVVDSSELLQSAAISGRACFTRHTSGRARLTSNLDLLQFLPAVPDPKSDRVSCEAVLEAFLRLIRNRTFSRTNNWSAKELEDLEKCRTILDTLLVHHCCHQTGDLHQIRVIAERVRRAFYAKAFRYSSDSLFEKNLRQKLWDNCSAEIWLYRQIKEEALKVANLPFEELLQLEEDLGVSDLWKQDLPKLDKKVPSADLPAHQLATHCARRTLEAQRCLKGCDLVHLQRLTYRHDDIAKAFGTSRATITRWLADCESLKSASKKVGGEFGAQQNRPSHG